MNRGMILLQRRVDQQRVKHIIDSFQLAGPDGCRFTALLDGLFEQYPSNWIELAIAEVVVINWLVIPMPRGVEVLCQVQNLLEQWSFKGITNLLTEQEFQRITGLDPYPVFHRLRLNALLRLDADILSCHR